MEQRGCTAAPPLPAYRPNLTPLRDRLVLSLSLSRPTVGTGRTGRAVCIASFVMPATCSLWDEDPTETALRMCANASGARWAKRCKPFGIARSRHSRSQIPHRPFQVKRSSNGNSDSPFSSQAR